MLLVPFVTGSIFNAAVLGISSDFNYDYMLSFVRSGGPKIRPLIIATDKKGESQAYLLNDQRQLLRSSDRTESPEHIQEVFTMLNAASRIKFIQSPPTVNLITWRSKKISPN